MLAYAQGKLGKREIKLNYDNVMQEQLDSLNLRKRNDLIRTLTHTSTGVNDNMLNHFPKLRGRSLELWNININPRKIRSDKIDLQFIDDYMHSICR